MKTHVVVTIYTVPGEPVLVHTYGPYTESRAKRERTKTMQEWREQVENGRLRVVACKMIDIDAMNNRIVQVPPTPASRLA